MKPLRLLANENFPQPSVEMLRAAGHDVLAIAEFASGTSDHAVLSLAVEKSVGYLRLIVTMEN
jgi:uncharacterized protein DUF5615